MQRSQEPGMGMGMGMGTDPRRLLVHSSNLMRTDVASIRLSDTTARDAQKGCGGTRHPGKSPVPRRPC
jgi:hypothetical protein